MSLRRTTGLLAIAVLLVATSLAAQGKGPMKQTLVFPVGAADAKSAPPAECVVTFGPAVPISAVAFSPDGKALAVGGYKEVLLWDLAAAKLSKRIGAGQLTGRVGAVAFLGKSSLLAVGDGVPGKSGAVRIFDVRTAALTRIFQEPADAVHCLAVSPDGKLLAAGGAYKEAHVWSVNDGKLVHTIKGHADWVTGVAFSPDGKLLVTASLDKSLQIWKVADWTRAGRGSSPEPLHGVVFDPRGQSVAAAVAGPSERGIRIWTTRYTRRSRATSTGEGRPLTIQWPAKRNRLYVGCSDGTIKSMSSWRGRPVSFRGHTDWVYAVTFSADGARFASGSADGTARLWNAADGKLLATLVQLAPRTDKWLIVTAQGYLATSSPDALRWRTKDLSMPPKELAAKLQNAESVKKILAGEKVAPPVLKQETPKK